jgi:hypothetical protein
MKRGKYYLIHYAKGTIQKDGYAILKVKLSVNYKYNNVTLIQLIQKTASGVQNHVGLADVDHARYCVLVTISQVQLPYKTHGIINNLNCI